MDVAVIYKVIGVLGFLAYISGFLSVQAGWLDGNGIGYALTSVVGAVLVLISLTADFNLASLMIQVSWIIIGCFGICRKLRGRPARNPHPALATSRR